MALTDYTYYHRRQISLADYRKYANGEKRCFTLSGATPTPNVGDVIILQLDNIGAYGGSDLPLIYRIAGVESTATVGTYEITLGVAYLDIYGNIV